jgi:5-enolpyruvylshikimate-3-phosphate synthase
MKRSFAKVISGFEIRSNFSECFDSLLLTPIRNAMETLAQIGADLEARDNRGRTPLRLAEDGRRDLAFIDYVDVNVPSQSSFDKVAQYLQS